jgi:iron complex transport system substrate-binding protein
MFQKKRIIGKLALILAIIMVLTGLSGCSDDTTSGEITVTDALGRTVTLSATAETAVAIGPGALRLYCYAGDVSALCGIEQIEVDDATGRSYMYANPDLADLTVIGAGGPSNSPDAEKLITADPDVIFTTYVTDEAAADELQEKTGIPVIVLSYGTGAPFSDGIYDSLTAIGVAMGTEEQAEKVVAYLQDCAADLDTRTANIADEDKVTVYYGAQSYKGTHGIESTTGGYGLFAALNTESVVDTADISGYVMLDKEQLLEWDPDVIFIDLGGLSLVQEDYDENPEYYEALTAFTSGNVYSQLPYNYYSANVDIAIIDAYYMGMVLYPDEFSDIDLEDKAAEIFETLLGVDVYDEYVSDFGPLSALTFN